MILDKDAMEDIAKIAAHVQQRVYYERERLQPKEGDIGAYLQRREYHLIVSIVREMWVLGWRPTAAKADQPRAKKGTTKRD